MHVAVVGVAGEDVGGAVSCHGSGDLPVRGGGTVGGGEVDAVPGAVLGEVGDLEVSVGGVTGDQVERTAGGEGGRCSAGGGGRALDAAVGGHVVHLPGPSGGVGDAHVHVPVEGTAGEDVRDAVAVDTDRCLPVGGAGAVVVGEVGQVPGAALGQPGDLKVSVGGVTGGDVEGAVGGDCGRGCPAGHRRGARVDGHVGGVPASGTGSIGGDEVSVGGIATQHVYGAVLRGRLGGAHEGRLGVTGGDCRASPGLDVGDPAGVVVGTGLAVPVVADSEAAGGTGGGGGVLGAGHERAVDVQVHGAGRLVVARGDLGPHAGHGGAAGHSIEEPTGAGTGVEAELPAGGGGDQCHA